MKEIMITSGAYGHRAEGSPFVHVVVKGETCIVTDQEAERLVNIGVAKILCANVVDAEYSEVIAEDVADDIVEEVDIDTLTFNELKEMAKDMGIENVGKLKSKQKLIDAILSYEDDADAPELAAEGLVD